MSNEYIKTFEEFTKYRYPEFNDSFDRFMLLNGVDENTVTNDMMNWYFENQWHGYSHPMIFEKHKGGYFINEMLKSTPIDVLKRELNRVLCGDKENFVGIWNEDNGIYDLFIPVKIYDVDKIKNACDRMMWMFTGIGIGVGDNGKRHIIWSSPDGEESPYLFNSGDMVGYRILIEPMKIEPVTDFVKNECGNVLYHLCLKRNTDLILKSGLMTKCGENSSRLIDKRVFLICGKTKEDILYNINKVCETKGWIDADYDIIEVNVGKHNIDFYRDCFYDDYRRYIVYTYGYFPPSMLKKIDINKLK